MVIHPIPIGETVGERLESLKIEGERRGRVTRFAVLYNERKVWAPKEREFIALSNEIQSWYPNLPGNQTELAAGNGCDVQIGEKSVKKDWISMIAVYKAVGGLKAFRAICTVTFKALSNVIGNAAAEALQVEAQTGYRKLTAVAHVAPAVELPKAA